MMLQTLTPSEEEVMQIIWKEGQTYFRDLMNIFPEPKPHQNTVSTFLKILVEKHYLNVEKQGRIYLYRPAVEFVDYRKFVLKRFLENYFNNSGGELFNILLDEELITAEDFENSIKSRAVFATKPKHENHIQDFIKEITSDKKSKKKEKDKKKKKDKKK